MRFWSCGLAVALLGFAPLAQAGGADGNLADATALSRPVARWPLLSSAFGQSATKDLAWASSSRPAASIDQAGEIQLTSAKTDQFIKPALRTFGPRSSGLKGMFPACDDCPNYGGMGFVSYDSWRGISDGSWQNNGVVAGLNYGTRLGAFSDLTGIGFQMGGSVGAFNWSGTDYRFKDRNEAQTQGFLTYGFFRKANDRSRFNAAIVQDWMFNDNFGVYAQNPTLSQGRAQVGYAVNAANEFGLWGTWRYLSDSRFVAGEDERIVWRPISQLNLYWQHKWSAGGADTRIWVGVPERHRLSGGGSLGDYLAGALANVPLSDRFGLFTLVTYMHPSARPGPAGSREDAWNFSVGVTLFPGRIARSTNVSGRCWMPQLPVANNGYFLNDTNHSY